MPLMGSLYIGSSGLQTSQNALNTTAHNLSNVDTTGYTRQQVQQSNRAYVTLSTDPKSIANKQTGLGVTYSRVKQVRDYFLDKTYRKESGRSMFYEVSTEVMEGRVERRGFSDDHDRFLDCSTGAFQGSQQLRHAGTDRTESIRIRAESKCGICWLKFLSGQPEYTDQTECG